MRFYCPNCGKWITDLSIRVKLPINITIDRYTTATITQKGDKLIITTYHRTDPLLKKISEKPITDEEALHLIAEEYIQLE